MTNLISEGQAVYISDGCDGVGLIKYTAPHTSLPANAITTGWELDQGDSYGFLSWSNGTPGAGGFFACSRAGNASVGPWVVFVQLPEVKFGPECLGFDIITAYETAPAAWEYA